MLIYPGRESQVTFGGARWLGPDARWARAAGERVLPPPPRPCPEIVYNMEGCLRDSGYDSDVDPSERRPQRRQRLGMDFAPKKFMVRA